MADVDERLNALLARALDSGSSQEEARTCALICLQHAKKHGRRVVFVDDAAEPVGTAFANPPAAAPLDEILDALFGIAAAERARTAAASAAAGIPPSRWDTMPAWMQNMLRAGFQVAVKETVREVSDAARRRAPERKKR